MHSKKKLRRKVKEYLTSLSSDQKKEFSQAINKNLIEYVSQNTHLHTIASFEAFSTEPNLQELHQYLRRQGKEVVFPDYKKNEKPLLRTSKWELVPIEKIDLFLIPGRVFSPQWHRIGRGGWRYDRLLENTQKTKIGVCFSGQLKELTRESQEHDIKMNTIITEAEIYK